MYKFELLTPWKGVKLQSELVDLSYIRQMFNTVIIAKDYPSDWKGVKVNAILCPALGLPSNKNNHCLGN